MSILQMMMAGLSLEYEGVITSGDLHIATKDGEAMFFHDSIDFSAFAGTDAGSTPYKFTFVDSAGKTAIAYGGATGGGEALGAELVTNGDFSAFSGTIDDASTDTFTGWILREDNGDAEFYAESDVPNGYDNLLKYIQASAPYNQWNHALNQAISIQAQSIYKYSADFKGNGNVAFLDDVQAAGGFSYMYLLTTEWENKNIVFTANAQSSDISVRLGQATLAYVSRVSVKKLTDIPSTGLHLMSTKNGTTRNMASVETGFNPNAIVGVKIYG